MTMKNVQNDSLELFMTMKNVQNDSLELFMTMKNVQNDSLELFMTMKNVQNDSLELVMTMKNVLIYKNCCIYSFTKCLLIYRAESMFNIIFLSRKFCMTACSIKRSKKLSLATTC